MAQPKPILALFQTVILGFPLLHGLPSIPPFEQALMGSRMDLTRVEKAWYVDAQSGNDAEVGSESKPWRSLERAREALRLASPKMTGHLVVNLSGRFTLTNTFTLGPQDSGRAGLFAIWKSKDGANAVLDGGVALGPFTPAGNGVWKTRAGGLDFRQAWIDGVRATRARAPNGDAYFRYAESDTNARRFLVQWKDAETYLPEGPLPGKIEWHFDMIWTRHLYQLTSAEKRAGLVALGSETPLAEGTWRRGIAFYWPGAAWHLENARLLLDEPGEWFLDTERDVFNWMPRPGEDPASVRVVAPRTETLLRIEGSPENPAHDIRIVGLRFEYSTWTAPSRGGFKPSQSCMGYARWSSWNDFETMKPAAGVELQHAHRISFERNLLQHMGGSGLGMNEGAKACAVVGNVFIDIAANGIQEGRFFTELPAAARKGRGEDIMFNPADMRLCCESNVIANNFFTRVGADYPDGNAVAVGFTRASRVEHNEIADVPTSGISVGWGWRYLPSVMKGNLILGNEVMGFNRLEGEGGGIYTLGIMPQSLMAENFVHDQWRHPAAANQAIAGIYLDNGTSGLTVERNQVEDVAQPFNGFEERIRESLRTDTPASNQPPIIGDNRTFFPDVRARAGLEPAFGDIRPFPMPTVWPGLHHRALSVGLRHGAGWEIRYTLDGSDPSMGRRYEKPLLLSNSLTLRAIALRGSQRSDPFAGHYRILPARSETFGSEQRQAFLFSDGRCTPQASTNSGFLWAAHPSMPARGVDQVKIDGNMTGRITFLGGNPDSRGFGPGAYLYTRFSVAETRMLPVSLASFRNGSIVFGQRGDTAKKPWPCHFRFLVRDAKERWFLSTEESAVSVYGAGENTVPIRDLRWKRVDGAQSVRLDEALAGGGDPGTLTDSGTEAIPDLSRLTGGGLFFGRTPESLAWFSISSVKWIAGESD